MDYEDVTPTWAAAAQIFAAAYESSAGHDHLEALMDMGRGLDFILGMERVDGEILLDKWALAKLGSILNGGK